MVATSIRHSGEATMLFHELLRPSKFPRRERRKAIPTSSTRRGTRSSALFLPPRPVTPSLDYPYRVRQGKSAFPGQSVMNLRSPGDNENALLCGHPMSGCSRTRSRGAAWSAEAMLQPYKAGASSGTPKPRSSHLNAQATLRAAIGRVPLAPSNASCCQVARNELPSLRLVRAATPP